jgi:hypothetical protein
VRGQLVLHHLSLTDPRIAIGDWVDAIHASLVTAPTDVLKSLNQTLIVAAVQADPEGARATWGLLPEHQVTRPAEEVFRQNEQQPGR